MHKLTDEQLAKLGAEVAELKADLHVVENALSNNQGGTVDWDKLTTKLNLLAEKTGGWVGIGFGQTTSQEPATDPELPAGLPETFEHPTTRETHKRPKR